MDIAEMVIHGWKFQLVNDGLSITSEQNPEVHLELEAKAAFSLLDYLYQYRDDLAVAAQGDQATETDDGGIRMETPFARSASDTMREGLTPRGL